ncbi:phage terminase large subunit [Chromobacterium haemolyticum]|nr:phage terminase large subunit [Chromobacterium haemolyticum]
MEKKLQPSASACEILVSENDILRADLLCEFEFFARWFFKAQTGRKFIVAPHHRQIIETLEAVARGDIKRLIINIPPRYGKTELAVKLFIAWCLANNPAAKFIHLSYSDDLALDNSSAVRDLIKHEEFQRLFDVKLKADSDSKKKWYTNQSGGVYATSAGGAITGFGAGLVGREKKGTGSPADGFGGCIIIDDPVKPDDAFSETMRGRINRRFNNTIASRVNSPDTPIIVIMQRLHEDDMTGFLLKGGSDEEWHHLCLSAITEDGEALWPDKHPLEKLESMRRADSYTFAGQYMQRPSPLGGGLIKSDWFQRYTIPPRITYRKIYADTAQKTGERNDYSVFQCWGYGEDRKIYLLDQIRGKWEAPELKRRAVEFWAKHSALLELGYCRGMSVEDKSSGTGLIQEIKASSGIPINGIERTKDKLTRYMDGLGWIESGHVLIPQDAPFVSDFLSEMESITPDDSHPHDDQADPMFDAIQDMLASNSALSVWLRL